ncbi:response regulator transcription factor [Trinickia acidisoli]|uniref:response regulator transcription factor n=1 Tax=Trinickia acidisoli TaxID=2767482 RepID=UPI001A8FB438|nr:response regulator transcription factor [Trinickia acidisoli]
MMQAAGKPVRVLVVEDDPAQHAMLVAWLKAEGYQVTSFHDGLEARNYLSDHWADLLLLDWDVPGVNGEQLLSFVRGRSRSSVPVIFQTVHSSEADIAKILDTGADDFLVKPVDRTVLLARMRAVLRRASSTNVDGRKMIVGECVLDRGKQALVANGTAHPLGTKEFDILWHLATHAGTVVQRQDLLSVVWGWDANVQSRSVDMYVSRVRSNLKAAGVGWTIQSVYATGYRLNMNASEEGAADSESRAIVTPADSPSAASYSPSEEPSLESVWSNRKPS